jgi:ubiquinone/menaquinone biosynthesis C-methylase UbiE
LITNFQRIRKTEARMQPDDYIEANRRMWNETAQVHARGYVTGLREQVKSPGFSTFDHVEKPLFARIGLAGKSVIQLACNNGRELISIKKAGAGRCVGVDISDGFIAQAQELARLGGVEVEFLALSVYDLPRSLDGQFDLVYITIGALGWLPDLDALFEIASRLLKGGGQLFIYEMHPILNMFNPDKGPVLEASYFRTEPFEEGEGPDYMDPSQVVKAVSYWFPHTLADVIGGCLKHGLAVSHFEEYGHDISMVFAAFERLEAKPPLSYSLLAVKTDGDRLDRLDEIPSNKLGH